MTDYVKPAVRHAWGETAGGTNLVDPGDSYAEAGWPLSSTPPPRQYFNWAQNYVFAAVRYFCQAGVPDYDASENYRVNSIVRGPDGLVYQSKVANNIGNAPAASPAQWGPATVVTPAGGDSSNAVATTAYVSNNFLPKGSSFAAIAGTLANGQLVVGNITQFQGALQIAGGQITSAVNQANHLVISGNVTTFNWSGQGGQPTWLFGSNDGVNFYVYSPSNFSVNALQGYTPTASPAGSTVMLRDASGYAYATYFNQTSGNNENPGVSQVMVTNGDNFIRKAGISYFINQLDPGASIAPNGYKRLPNGRIMQWATVNLGDPGGPGSGSNGTIFGYAYFPLTFSDIAGWATDLQDLDGGLGSVVWNTITVNGAYASFGGHEVTGGVQSCQFRIYAIGQA
jgi:hypothetical protein